MDFAIKEDNGFKYIDEGKGEVIVLLHGLMGALSNWQHVVDHFKENYRVIIPMLPIYEMPILTTGVKSLSKFLKKFVTHFDLKDILIVGNSLGGHVGLMYVLSNQENVKALILAGSSGLYENAFGGSFPKRGNFQYIKEKTEFTFYDPATATPDLVDEVFATVNNREKAIRILAMAKS